MAAGGMRDGGDRDAQSGTGHGRGRVCVTGGGEEAEEQQVEYSVRQQEV